MVDIKDTSGKVIFSTPINEGSKRRYTLMKEDYVTLKFSLDNPIYFKLGDGIDNEIGLFELIDIYKPTYNERNGAYDYELRLDAYYMKWKNKKFFFTPENGAREASWCLTDSLAGHGDVLLKNLAALGYTYRGQTFEVIVDESVKNEARFIDYQNINLIDALTKMAEVFDCEWWIIDKYIKFGRCENANPPIDFVFDDNISKMSRKDSQSTFATRVYAFGSDRNIPRSYRKKLEFDVKTINGRDMSDTARVLESRFFPEEFYNYSSFETRDDHESFSGEGKFTKNQPLKIVAFRTESFCVKKGMHRLIPESVSLSISKGAAGYAFKGELNLDIKIIYTLNGIEKSVLMASGKTEPNPSGDKCRLSITDSSTFTLEDDIKDFRYSLEASVGYIGEKGINYNYDCFFKAVIQRVAVSINAPIVFQSGSNKGKSFSAIVNPDFKEGVESNVIRLPEGVTASKGDRYTIDNIIKSRVPASFFTATSSEATVEGIITRRLMLPIGTPHIDAFPNMSKEDIIEEVVVFDDIYPQREGVMSDVDKGDKIYIKDDKGINTEEFYYEYTFKDTGLKNFSASYKLEGVDLEITFSTESKHLIGRKFVVELVSSDDTGTVFRIKAIQEGARYIPDETLCPVDGDKYVLAGYDVDLVSTTLIPNAEAKLKERALEYIEKLKIDPSVYDCTLNSTYAYNVGKGRLFGVGERVNLVNPAYFENGRLSRIIGYEFNLDIPYNNPTYTVGETAPYSRIGALESKVDSLTYKGQTYTNNGTIVGGASVYLIGTNDSETNPTDRNTFSAAKLVDMFSNYLSKSKPDSALELITFLKGLKSNDLVTLLKGLHVSGGADVDNLHVIETLAAKMVDAVKISATNIDAQQADIVNAVIKRIQSAGYTSGMLGSGLWLGVDENGNARIEVDNALIRKEAIFNKLTTAEMQSVGGQIVLSIANMECLRVEDIGDAYRCFFDNDNGSIPNKFAKYDQAIRRTSDGLNAKYYWRLVVGVGVDYIDLSKTDCDGTSIPEARDSIVQLGNRVDKNRQNAIILSSYGTPSIKQYDDIHSYSLEGCEVTVISPDGNKFTGDFRIKSGNRIIPIPADRGAFVSGEAYRYYDRVSHDGALWLCVIAEGKTTTEAPSSTSQAWVKQVDKGADGKPGAAGKDGKDAGVNLINWQETWKEGSFPSGWQLNGTVSENSIVLGDNPFGNKSLLWKCVPDSGGNASGGFRTPYYTLDNEHTYRYTAFVYREKAIHETGRIYHGCDNVADLYGASLDNPYFATDTLPAGEWFLMVGYIHPSKANLSWQMPTSGIYNMSGKRVLVRYDFKLRNPAIPVLFRNYLYYTDNPEDVAYFYNPRLEVCDGNEPSIEQLLRVKVSDVANDINVLKTTYSTEFTKTNQMISLKAEKSEVSAIGSRLSNAEAKITADAINMTVKSQTERIVANKLEKTTAQVDGRNLDPNKYYPITITLLSNKPQTITVERPLNAPYGVPPYATHSSGFSMMCRWTSNGSGWGASQVHRTIDVLTYSFVPSCPCGSIGQLTYSSREYIYVRGGSKYNVEVEGFANSEIILRTEDYTWSSSSGKYSQSIKVLDSIAVPELTYANKVETAAELNILSDKIESKVGADTFNALGVKVSSVESNVQQQAGLIASKVSQSTFDALGNRVTTAESSITQMPNKISAEIKGSEEKIKSSLTLDSSGLSLLGKKIALTGVVTFASLASDAQNKVNTAQSTANSAVSKADAAQGTANSANSGLSTLKSNLKDLAYQDKVGLAKLDETIVEGGFIKTNLIDANSLTVGEINSKNGNFRTLPDGTVEGTNAKFIDGDFRGVVKLSTAYSGNLAGANLIYLKPIVSDTVYRMPHGWEQCGKVIKLFNGSPVGGGVYYIELYAFGLYNYVNGVWLGTDSTIGTKVGTNYKITVMPQETIEVTCYQLPPKAFGCSYEMCYQWVPTNRFTIETYKVNGNTWYSKRSDGWLECGGAFSAGEDWVFNVNFPQPFYDTSYHVLATKKMSRTKNQYLNGIMVRPANKFSFTADIQDYAGDWTYYACGIWKM